MLSLTAVMPPHEIDHDADGDEDHGAGRPAENAESANIGDHKRCDPERRGRRRRCRQGKARSVGHISHSSSPSSSIPVSGNEKDNRGQQYHQEEHDRRHDESPGDWRERQLSVLGYGDRADQQHDEHHGDSHREPHARRPRHRLMTMSVVDIGVMRMAVEQALVNVSMRMRLTRRRR